MAGRSQPDTTVTPLVVVNCTLQRQQHHLQWGAITNLCQYSVSTAALWAIPAPMAAGSSVSGLPPRSTMLFCGGTRRPRYSKPGHCHRDGDLQPVEGGFTAAADILTSDPQFGEADGPDNVYGTLDDDLHLHSWLARHRCRGQHATASRCGRFGWRRQYRETIPLDLDGGEPVS